MRREERAPGHDWVPNPTDHRVQVERQSWERYVDAKKDQETVPKFDARNDDQRAWPQEDQKLSPAGHQLTAERKLNEVRRALEADRIQQKNQPAATEGEGDVKGVQAALNSMNSAHYKGAPKMQSTEDSQNSSTEENVLEGRAAWRECLHVEGKAANDRLEDKWFTHEPPAKTHDGDRRHHHHKSSSSLAQGSGGIEKLGSQGKYKDEENHAADRGMPRSNDDNQYQPSHENLGADAKFQTNEGAIKVGH
jgi:hypothetical protein